ncbi:MAG: hypothetical protein VX223_06765, partial [Myxococcota bacterium]|nr:hypothetical protein [Myxococcota bacterium]
MRYTQLQRRMTAVICSLLIAGCNDSAGTKAIPLPTSFDLQFIGLTEGQQVFGTVELLVTVADDAGDNNIESIRVFPMDLPDTDARSLYYAASWDTNASPEGDITLEAVAQTTAGRIGRAEITVRIVRSKGTGLSGTASFGRPIASGTVTVFAREGMRPGIELGTARTKADGQFNVPYVDDEYIGPVLIRLSGTDATFIDPATEQLMYFTENDALWSAVPATDGEKPTGIAINGLTHLVVETARGLETGGLSAEEALETAEALQTAHLFGAPFSMHQPLELLLGPNEWPAADTAVALFHVSLARLAAFWDESPTPVTLFALLDALSLDLGDGVFDGIGPEGKTLTLGSRALTADTTRLDLAHAAHDAMVAGGYDTTQLTYDDLADDIGFCTYISTDVSALYPADTPATRFDVVPPTILWVGQPENDAEEVIYVGVNKQTVTVAYRDHTLQSTTLVIDGYTFEDAQSNPSTPDAVAAEPVEGDPALAISIPWPEGAQTGDT